MSKFQASGLAGLSRRRFVQGLAAGSVMAGVGGSPAHGAVPPASRAAQLAGRDFHLSIGESTVDFTGRPRTAITVNGSLPAPTLRWREGDTVTLRVQNRLRAVPSSIHWHGLLLPASMDGVPGLSFDGIAPG